MQKISNNKLILGTVQFGLEYGINNSIGKPSFEVIKDILDLAFLNGVNILDTAEAYGDSQEILGRYHKQSKNKFEIITKFCRTRKDLSEDILKRVETDLTTLNVESLYCYMYHSFNDFISFYKKDSDRIKNLKQQKLIKKFGISVYTNEEIEAVLEFKEVDLIQLPFNILDNINLRGEIIRKANENGVEVHTRSTFLQGLIFKNSNDLSSSLKPIKPYLDSIKCISKNYNITIQDLALKYVLSQKKINNILIGVETLEQLEMNFNITLNNLSQETINEINAINIKDVRLLNPSNW